MSPTPLLWHFLHFSWFPTRALCMCLGNKVLGTTGKRKHRKFLSYISHPQLLVAKQCLGWRTQFFAKTKQQLLPEGCDESLLQVTALTKCYSAPLRAVLRLLAIWGFGFKVCSRELLTKRWTWPFIRVHCRTSRNKQLAGFTAGHVALVENIKRPTPWSISQLPKN